MSIMREVMILIVLVITGVMSEELFDKYYEPLWGFDHLSVTDEGKEVRLLIDSSSGAGFKSKQEYCSGVFRLQIKVSDKISRGGIITSFYILSREGINGIHDEMDIEFLGTNGTVQTNVYTNDIEGHREEKIKLGFNPSADFHAYEINWNHTKILFKVDNKTIRVFNTTEKYIWKPLHVEVTLWNESSWGGIVDWSKAPFTSYFRGFYIEGTPCK